MKTPVGPLLIAIGLLHTIYGVLENHGQISAMWQAGLINSLQKIESKYAFWFLMAGFQLIILGQLCLRFEKTAGTPLPAFLGWELLAFSITGVALMPKSGFWLVLAVAVYQLVTFY